MRISTKLLCNPHYDEYVFYHPLLITADSIFDICRQYKEHHIHRMPVFDAEQNAVLYVATHRRILKYMVDNLRTDITLFQHTLADLKIGTWGHDVCSVPFNMKMMDGKLIYFVVLSYRIFFTLFTFSRANTYIHHSVIFILNRCCYQY